MKVDTYLFKGWMLQRFGLVADYACLINATIEMLLNEICRLYEI